MNDQEREQMKQDAADIRKNYTRAANMLIFGYRELSPQEKWLYFCLIHLCGARGTRYLSLRYISEQTGISTGAMSTSKDKNGKINEGMIRHLHDAGLIHAEIKKRDGRNNAQYHISIVDVWALNQAFFIERKAVRSDFGQDEDETIEPVRNSDTPVQISDKPARISDKGVQISDEPVRNPGQLQDYSKTTNKITDKTTEQEGTHCADAQPPAQLPPHFHRIGEFIGQWGYYYHPSKPWLRWDSLLTPAVIVVVISGDIETDRQRKADGLELLQHLSRQHADIELHYQPEAEATPPFEGSWQTPVPSSQDAYTLEDTPYRPDENDSHIASTPQGEPDGHTNTTTSDRMAAMRTDRDTLRVFRDGSQSPAGDTHRTASPQQQSGDRVPLAYPAEHAADGGANARTVMGGSGLTPRDHESTQTRQRFQVDATTGVSAGAGGYEKAGSRAGSSRPRSSQRSVTGEEKQSKRTSKSSSEAMKSEPLTMPPEDAPWNTTTCLHLFDFWRGAPLLRKDECMKASHCAKGLAENYTRKQVETVRRWMRERDPYWSQRASSVDVCQVAGQIHRILADIEAARQVKRAASTQAVDPQVAAVRALAQRFSAPVGER